LTPRMGVMLASATRRTCALTRPARPIPSEECEPRCVPLQVAIIGAGPAPIFALNDEARRVSVARPCFSPVRTECDKCCRGPRQILGIAARWAWPVPWIQRPCPAGCSSPGLLARHNPQ
jgi:hypothetical protein